MKTISEAVNERLSRINNIKEVNKEDVIDAVYEKFPELKKIDSQLIEVRAEKLIASIEHDTDPIEALNKREADLLSEREKFLLDNNIRDDFDSTRAICRKCNDTGYVKTNDGRSVVCPDCMKDAVNEVFDASGLKDYSTFTLKSFDLEYYEDKGARREKFNKLQKVMTRKSDTSIMILNGTVASGKTYLAVISCKYAIIQGFSAHYLKADRLYELTEEQLDDLKTYDYIVIDDYVPEITRVYKNATNLHALLEARTASNLPTVIVSSMPLAELVDGSEERIAGKLRGAGTL